MTASAAAARRVSPNRVVASLTLASLAYSLLQMMVVPALPEIQRQLHAGAGAVVWLISAYLLSTAVATPVLGRLGDLFGKERMMLVALVLLACGSLLGALSGTLGMLVCARVLQGMGGAVFPLSFGIARETLPAAKVPMAVGIVSGSFGVGGSLGLLLGGPLVDHVSWHAIFWAGLLMPVVAIVAIRAFVPGSGVRRQVSLDWVGALLLVAGVVPLLTAVAQGNAWGWTSAATVGLFAGGAGVLAVCVGWELRRHDPLIDVRLLARRSIWPANAVIALVGFSMYANGYLIPQFVQADGDATGYGFGASVTAASLFLLPATLSGLAGGALAGWLGGRVGTRPPLLAGCATMVAGYVLLTFLHDTPLPVYAGTLLAHGIGLNLCLAAISNHVVAAAAEGQTGEAAGVNAMVRTVGGSLGSQIVAALIAGSAIAGEAAGERGFTLAFALCGLLMLAGLAITATLVRSPAATALPNR